MMKNAALPIVGLMLRAAGESLELMRVDVGEVAYGMLGYWRFQFRGQWWIMPEPVIDGGWVVLGINPEVDRRLAMRAILDQEAKPE